MVLWGLKLCWGLKGEVGIWLVNILGRKELDLYWFCYRLLVGSVMGGNIYFIYIFYDFGWIRGNLIRK